MARARVFVVLGLLLGAVSCGGEPARVTDGRTGSVRQPFASAEATLVDFAFDGALVARTADPAVAAKLVRAQLLYAVGQLNGHRAVGRYERLVVSDLAVTARPDGAFDVRYRATLPVAWGSGPPPAAYELVLPARVEPEEQARFARAYGATCVDPEGGNLDANRDDHVGRMFLVYRPQRPACALAPGDVARMPARVTVSSENTIGKMPEYARIWDDGVLQVTVVFGREYDDGRRDAGEGAHDDYLRKADAYLTALQPDASRRSVTMPADGGSRLEVTLADGRAVRLDTLLTGTQIAHERTAFDAWLDARSVESDILVYSGHAGHGANVRTLLGKGAYRPGKYLVLVMNGCDTFAYLDETLARRRAALNPDDPGGTKYMDTVSNVLGGWFHTGDDTALRFVRAAVEGGGPAAQPRTYPEIFADIDRDQVVVVTGEEDNGTGASEPSAPPPGDPPARGGTPPAPDVPPASAAPAPSARGEDAGGGCRAAGAGASSARAPGVAAALGALAALVRRRREEPRREKKGGRS